MKSLRYDLVVLCVVGIMVAWYGEIEPASFASQSELDLVQYTRMASAAPLLDRTVPAPFVYRIAPPFLAGILAPFVGSEVQAFRLLTYLALAGCALQFRRWLVDRRVSEHSALMVTALLCISPHISGAVIFNPYQFTDALSFLVIITSLRVLESRTWWAFGLAMFVGALTRETCLLMVPVAVVWILRQQDQTPDRWRKMISLIAWSMPSFIVASAVRLMMTPVNTDWNVAGNVAIYSWKFTDPVSWYRLVVNSMAPLSLLPLFYFRDFTSYLHDNLHLALLYVLIVVASFAGKDVERLIAPSFPLVLGFAAIILDSRVRLSGWTFGILAVGGVLTALHPLYSAVPMVDRTTYIALSVLAAVAVPALLYQQRVRDF